MEAVKERRKPGPKKKKLPREVILRQLEELEKLEAEARKKLDEAQKANPFWFFEPSTGEITPDRLEFLKKHIKEEDVPPKLDSQLDILLSTAPTIGAFGGNQCLGGETEIYDPVKRTYTRVDQIKDNFHVYAWDGERLVIAEAQRPFTKPVDALYRFELSNGQSFVASMSHLVLTQTGYLSLRDVTSEGLSFLQPTSLDICQSVLGEDGQSSLKIAQDSQCGCPVCLRLYGGQLREVANNGLNVSPLLSDAHVHKGQAFSHEDDLEYKSEHSHVYQVSGLPSSQDGQLHREGHDADFESDDACILLKSSCQLCQEGQLSHDASIPVLPPTDGFVLQASHACSTKASSVTSDLVVTSVTYLRDDCKWDFTVPIHHNYYLAGAIHHNSGKSTIGAINRYIQVTGEVPIALEGIYPKERLRTDFSYCERVRVVGVDNKTLLNTVIPTYQKWVPREYLKKGSWIESYSAEQRTLFLYRNGKGEPIASFEFMTNQQEVESFQGPPIHRITYDEQPKESIRKENLMRFVTTGKVDEMFCMTPTNGISWATDLFDGDTPEEGTECYKLVSLTNKMASLEALDRILHSLESYEEKKMRLLGETISLSGLVYGRLFDKRVHVIPPFFEKLSAAEKKDYLLITGMDPHLVTPTAMVFILLDREGNTYVDRCWHKEGDTDEIKAAWHAVVNEMGYRKGWAVADKSSNSSIMAFGGRNIFMELSRGKNAIPALRTSEKFEGSIKAGVDEIKRRLKVDGNGRPRFFIVDRPENKLLINSFRTLERDTYADEEKNGPKDRIKEGKHHLHAAARYIFQYPLNYWPPIDVVPQPELHDEAACW